MAVERALRPMLGIVSLSLLWTTAAMNTCALPWCEWHQVGVESRRDSLTWVSLYKPNGPTKFAEFCGFPEDVSIAEAAISKGFELKVHSTQQYVPRRRSAAQPLR